MEKKIFHTPYYQFDTLAMEIFYFQYYNNTVYKKFVDALKIIPENINTIETIPFMPISLFKTHEIRTTNFEPEVIFESSGTTGMHTSKHFVKNLPVYVESFSKGFSQFYGNPSRWCIIGLLPNYLERDNSSLVYMVHRLISESNNSNSGFYLDDFEKLYKTVVHNEMMEIPTLLVGVTFALLDFAEKYALKLNHTTIMETGGMKGRREEITREEVHDTLKKKLGVSEIHSEYGMTELLSQAYSAGDGRFHCPSWLKILIREYNDPFAITAPGHNEELVNGLINVIDLANIYSCSFIATDDVGKLYKNGSFEVLGRRDTSDLRGCSLLTVD
ncbi:MAG: acyl transferase [Ginsengibacter sp.]